MKKMRKTHPWFEMRKKMRKKRFLAEVVVKVFRQPLLFAFF